jgi:hypothetical protein
MAYYILPNHNNNISFHFINDITCNKSEIFISNSLYNNYNIIKNQLINMCNFEDDASLNVFEEIVKIINISEYILVVSKLNPYTNGFYDFLEIIKILNIYENCKNKDNNFLYISPNFKDIINYTKLVREKCYNDIIFGFNDINVLNYSFINEITYKFNFIFIENENNKFTSYQSYIINLINNLKIILKCQNKHGISIIKIDHIFFKPVVEILYLLSSIFDSILIMKPSSSNIITFEKYVICKNFLFSNTDKIIEDCYYSLCNISNNLNINNNFTILSLIDNEIPCYFINKLNDINVTLGQEQLKTLYQITNILKNKNKEEKIEVFKKNNIQKSINWCEKYQLSFNKFLDKNNIFLSTVKDKESNF